MVLPPSLLKIKKETKINIIILILRVLLRQNIVSRLFRIC